MTLREVRLPPGVAGRLFLASMPGRYEPLEEAEEAAGLLGMDAILSLAPLEEIGEKSPAYSRAIATGSLRCAFECIPVEDFGVPSDRAAYSESVRAAADGLTKGLSLLVHCGAGIGRTGTFASCILLALGAGPEQALGAVSDAGSHPETSEQEELVGWFERNRYGEKPGRPV
jgi:hypothetical protein